MAILVNELREDVNKQLKAVSRLPVQAAYTFGGSTEFKGQRLFVQKTTNRTVVSLNFSKFKAREIIRTEKNKNEIFHSPKLANIVPSGARYAYDLIAFVGRKSYLEGCRLKTIHEAIMNQRGLPHIPLRA